MYWFFLILSTFCLDQITKYLVVKNIALYESIKLFPGMNLFFTYNKGVAFGMFSESNFIGRWFFILIAVLVCCYLFYWLIKDNTPKVEKISICLIIAGALGNLTDRVLLAKVVDFIDIYIGAYHWYTFNIADSSICIGVFMLIIEPFLKKHKGKN